MADDHVSRILKMLEEGRISAEEAQSLLSAVNKEAAKAAPAPSAPSATITFAAAGSSREDASSASASSSTSGTKDAGAAKSFEFGWSQRKSSRFDFGNVGKQIADALKKLDPDKILREARTGIQRGSKAWQDRVKHWNWFGVDDAAAPQNVLGYPTATGTETLRFEASGPVLIQADNHWGDLSISGGADAVEVEISSTAWAPTDEEAKRLLQELRVVASHHCPPDSPARLELHATAPEGFDCGAIHIRIKAPNSASVRAATLFGDIKLADLQGTVEAQAASGDIDLKRMGSVHAEAISGDVKAEELTGAAKLESRGGLISATSLAAGGELSSVSGDVQANGVEGGPLTAKSVSGEVTVERVGLKAAVETTVESVSGDVRLREVQGNLTVKNVSGDTVADDITADAIQIKAVSGDIQVGAAKPFEGTLNVNTVSGNVALRFRPESSYRFTLSTQSGDLGCEPEAADSVKRDGVWSGRIGSGQGAVNVSTLSGDVNLQG